MTTAKTIERMRSDVATAMKARDSARVSAIRLLLASLEGKRIDKRDDLTEEEILGVLSTEAKKRREAATAFREGGRVELAEKEEGELAVIEEYLPAQLSDEEVAALVDEIVAETGAKQKSDLGRVMGKLMPRVKGRYDGSKVKAVVLARLG